MPGKNLDQTVRVTRTRECRLAARSIPLQLLVVSRRVIDELRELQQQWQCQQQQRVQLEWRSPDFRHPYYV